MHELKLFWSFVTFVNWDNSHVTILSSFTQPFVVPNLYDYAEHKSRP